ncbi:acyl-CoA N-acyltransferase [Mycena polygramma]|nr:acyl-CoA N-acyltransferase [Mycena polygramma]
MTITQSPEEKIIVLQHRSPVDFLACAYPTLRHHERTANIVLAPALSRAPAEYVLTHCQFIADADILLPFPLTQPVPSTNFWITVWSQHANSRPVLDMALSCLNSSLGDYPVFLWTPRSRACSTHIAPERVFSVFGTSNLATTFAHAWAGLTGFPVNPKPLYNAYFAVCTPHTLKNSASGNNCFARRATMHDIEAAARLCQDFANSSEYPLGIEEATAEARELIEKGLLWVGTMDGEIATVCAVTRTSLNVSAITKVYTLQDKRRNGLAQALVQEVTQRLFECGKHSVVLYVGCDNSGRRVYERVGFMIQEGDVCLELGFDGTNAGHW